MWGSHISIRATLLVFISILNLLIGLLVGFNVYKAWISYRDVQALHENLTVTTYFYQAEKYLSLERGVASSILYVDDDIQQFLLEELTENREKADIMLAAAFSAIKRLNDKAPSPALLEKVKERHGKLMTVRQEMDAALAAHDKSDDPGPVTGGYYDAVTGLTLDIGRYIDAYSLRVMTIDAQVNQQFLFKQHTWLITEYAGQEYAEMGWLIASNRYPSAEMRGKFHNRRGHIEYGWQSARRIAGDSNIQSAVMPYMDEAETHYFMTFDQTKDLFFSPGIEALDAPYPISIEIWLEMAAQAVESLLTMKDVAMVQNRQYVDQMAQAARNDIILSLLMFFCAVLLSLYSWSVITNRVINPVNAMVEALYHAIHGDPYKLPHAQHRYDEIGKLARILEVFQQKTKEWEDRKNYLKTVLATISDGIITTDEKGHIQMVNPAAEQMFGYSEEELVGRSIDMLIPLSERGDGDFLQKFFEVEENGIANTGRELMAHHHDGKVFPIDINIAEMRERGSRMYVGVMRDISQRKAAEEKINRYLFDLERSNQELDDFAYIASHDLKEPLRGLHNFSRFLVEDYEDKLDEEGKNMLETIAELTQRMESQLNALLHYSRLGRTDLSIQETDIRELVQEVIAMFAITVKETGAKIKITCDLPTITCDHVRIKEVFQNLICNALKYNEADIPEVEIGCIEDHKRAPGELVYFIRDNGIGIEKKYLESVFKIFRRLHPRTAYGGGTGSGLSIVKKIITQHKGTIWAESDGPGKGTTFYFTIPPQPVRAASEIL